MLTVANSGRRAHGCPHLDSSTLAPRAEDAGTGTIIPWLADAPITAPLEELPWDKQQRWYIVGTSSQGQRLLRLVTSRQTERYRQTREPAVLPYQHHKVQLLRWS